MMFQSVRKFFWDRRRTFFTFVGFVGGTWFLVRFITNHLGEVRDKVLQDRNAREILRKRFQQNQEDCTYHVLALVPSLGNAILEEMDVEDITLALQQQRIGAKPPPVSPPTPGAASSSHQNFGQSTSTDSYGSIPLRLVSKSKAELWKEMKILAFTRALTILYSLTILSLFTHIQLNLLGIQKYIQSVKQLGHKEDEEEQVTEKTERKFLTLGWWILNVGWKDVAERVRSAVEVVFSEVSLKTQLGLSDVEKLISDVRKHVEYQDSTSTETVSFLGTLIPGGELDQEFVLAQGGLPSHDAHIDPPLRSLIRSACEYASSADFAVVLRVCLDRGTDFLIHGLRKEVFGGRQDGGIGLSEGDTVRLAAMLPAVARWSHLAVNSIPNELVESLTNIREMTAFSAIMYSSTIDELAL